MEPPSALSALPPTIRGQYSRASRWRLARRELTFGQIPLVMGILNVTPDSFSDGGHFFDPKRAIDQGLLLAAQGADLIDIGGESTRPYSEAVSAAEEARRVAPVVAALAERLTIPLSIDTSKALVAREALAAGAEIINDVTGFREPDLLALAAETRAGVCAMHIQGTPQTMQDDPRYDNLVGEISAYLARRRDALVTAGVERERIVLDPGVGFGKTHQHNVTLTAEAWRFHALGCPLLVGHSRKGFLAKIIGDKQVDRTAATLGVTLSLAAQGVQIVRVHDVQPTRHALLAFAATGGIDDRQRDLSADAR